MNRAQKAGRLFALRVRRVCNQISWLAIKQTAKRTGFHYNNQKKARIDMYDDDDEKSYSGLLEDE